MVDPKYVLNFSQEVISIILENPREAFLIRDAMLLMSVKELKSLPPQLLVLCGIELPPEIKKQNKSKLAV